MIFWRVKITCFRAIAHRLFHWRLYNNSLYQLNPDKNYDVTVKTADSLGSGTDAFVYLKLVGERGESDENEVAKGQYENDFENDA